jgi:hypothetical protein
MVRIKDKSSHFKAEILNTNWIIQVVVKPSLFPWIVLLVMLLIPSLALAHVPLMSGGNEDISSALHISDPEKSWAIYGFLEPDMVHYYSFDMMKDERIYLKLLKSTDPKEEDFQPNLVLLGPGLESSGQLPEDLALPASLKDPGVLTVYGREAANATYEPFGPSSYIEMGEINISAPQSARYYAAIYSNNTTVAAGQAVGRLAGHYGLGVGYREEFSFTERITMPFQLISVYRWEGQSLGLLFLPYLVAEIIGILIFWRGSRRTAFCLAGTLGGFLFLATSSSVFTQMVFSLSRAPFGPEAYITLAIVVFHALLGVAVIRLARGEAGILQRTLLAVLGTIALLAGSGLLMGPILAISASLLPSKRGSILSNAYQKN